MPYPDKARVFVASSVQDKEKARQEVHLWASGNGYQFEQAGRTFTIFRPDAPPREWILLERAGTAHS